MALSAADSLATFDQSTGAKVDISPVLATVILSDTAFLGLIGMGQKALARTHKWDEDLLNNATVSQAAGETALSAAGTSLVLTSGEGGKLRVGTLLRDVAAGQSEVIQVTAISTDTLTITRGYGSTDGQTHLAAAVFLIVSQPVQEGDETITDISRARTQQSNYTEIKKRTVKITGSQQAESLNGIHPGVPDEAKYQLLHRTLELKRELNTTLIHSIISGAPSDTVYGTMKGLREWLTASGANNTSTSESLSESVINKMYKDAYDDGGEPADVVGNQDQIPSFADMNAAKLRIAPSDRVAGIFVNKFLTEFGKELSLTLDRWFQKDELALVQKDKMYYAPLQTREMFVEPLPKAGDALRWQVIMEGTMVVHNPTLVHSFHTNLVVPS